MEKQHICSCEMIHEALVERAQKNMRPEEEYQRLATLFKMFGDGTRVKILHALEQNELCVCDLAALLGMTKSAVSHQLKVLKDAQLVKFRRDGKNVYYTLKDDHVKTILEMGIEHIKEKD